MLHGTSSLKFGKIMNTNAEVEKQAVMEIIEDSGYLFPKTFEDGNVACLMPLLFTCAIISDIYRCGYGDRWCYHNINQAKAALNAWSGEDGTEPEGWHRHPSSGRRRDDNGNETIVF